MSEAMFGKFKLDAAEAAGALRATDHGIRYVMTDPKDDPKGYVHLTLWTGKGAKPFYDKYLRTQEDADKRLQGLVDGIGEAAKQKAQYKAEAKVDQERRNFGRLPNAGPKIEKAIAEARESVWEVFASINPLDFIDRTKLPPLVAR